MNTDFKKTLLAVGLVAGLVVGFFVTAAFLGGGLISSDQAQAKNNLGNKNVDYVCFKMKAQEIEGFVAWRYLNKHFQRLEGEGKIFGPTHFCTPVQKLDADIER